MQSIWEARNLLRAFKAKVQWLVSFPSSSSSFSLSLPAPPPPPLILPKSDITGIFLRMCDTLLCGEHGPGKLRRTGARVSMDVCPREVSVLKQ